MTTPEPIGRRTAIKMGLAATAAAALTPRRARAQTPREVKIALVVPLSGAWARQGILEQMYDTGDTAEKAKNAAQRLVAQEPDVVGGIGCWLSSFTLAVTEVTERAELPWLTLSYSDLITGRGYKYIFQSSPTAEAQSTALLPRIVDLATKATNVKPTKVAFVGDNSASSVSFMKPIREHVAKDLGLTIVADEVYTPPLADATTLVQKIRSGRPDFIVCQSTNVGDDKLLIDKFAERGITPSTVPLIGGGGHWCVPELMKVAGKEHLEGMIVLDLPLRARLDLQGGAGADRLRRPQEAGRDDAQDRPQGRSGQVLPGRPRQVRGERPPGGRRALHRAVAEGPPGGGAPGEHRRREGDLAEVVGGRVRPAGGREAPSTGRQ